MSTIELQNKPSIGQRRLTAILEVCGVYMVGQLIAFILMKVLGVEIQNPIAVLEANPNADLLEMAKNLAVILLLQYGGIMSLALTIGWWHRKRRISEYGVTKARQPILKQVWIGVVLFAVAELPVKLLVAIDHVIPLGAKAVTQNIASMLDWSDFKFWVFIAVGSFLLVPFVEEFFYRGYVQVRLGEDFDAPTAILVTALFFEFSHGQYYLTLSPWTVGMLLTGVFSSLAWGYTFYRTRSLIAPIVAHALLNFPTRGMADFLLPIAMLAIIVIYRKQIVEEFQTFGAMFKSDIVSKVGMVLASIFMVLFAVIVATAEDIAILFSIVAIIIALILEALEKRKTKNLQI